MLGNNQRRSRPIIRYPRAPRYGIRRVPELKRFAAFDVDKLWEIIEARRAGAGEEM